MSAIDTYLTSVNPTQKVELERIRAIVKETIPEAEEVISYGMPTFKYKGKPLIHFAAFKDHMSIFPTADPKVTQVGKALEKYRTGKGTLQFTEDDPIPEHLIKELALQRQRSINEDM